jgi:hypothetical protein
VKRERKCEREERKVLDRKTGTKNERNLDRKKGMKRRTKKYETTKHSSSN